MKKRLLVIIGVTLLSIFPSSAYAVNKLVNTSGVSTLSENTPGAADYSSLRFGPTLNKILSWNSTSGLAEDGAYVFDDDIVSEGNVEIGAGGFLYANGLALTNVSGTIDADSIDDGDTNVIITSTQETQFGTAYTHSQVSSGNPHSVNLDDAYHIGQRIMIDYGPLDLNVTGDGNGDAAGIDMDVESGGVSGDAIADFDLNWTTDKGASIDVDAFTINRNTDMNSTADITSSGSILRLTENISNLGGHNTIDTTALEIVKSANASGDYITGTYDSTEYFSITYTGNITTAGDLYVNGDDITADGTLTIDATGDQILLGAGNGNVDVIIDDGGLAVSSDAVAPSTPADGNVEIEDGSVCIGNGGCSPNAGDGYLDVAGNITVVGDIAVNGDDLTSDGDLTVTATGQQIYLGSGNGNTDVIIDDGGLAVSSDAVAPSTPTDGNVEIEDGSICIGDGGCSPNAGDGYLHAANDISSATGYMYNTSTVLNNMVSVAPDAQGTWPLELDNQSDITNATLDLTAYTSSTATAAFICSVIKDPNATAADPIYAFFQKYGLSLPDWRDISIENHASTADWNTLCAWVQMDSLQRITYNFKDAGAGGNASCYVNVTAYLEPTT